MGNRNLIIIALIIAIISLLMDWYVFQAIKTISMTWENKIVKQLIRWIYWFILPALTLYIIYGFFQIRNDRSLGPAIQYTLSIFLILFIAKFMIIASLLTEDIYRATAGIINKFIRSFPENSDSFLPERRKFFSQLGIILAALPFTSFIYGMVKGKYDYKVHRHTLYFDGLPEEFDGFTITQISDIHAGSFDNKEAVQRGINLINQQKSDLIVFTGDFVNNVAEELDPWIDEFSQIQAPFGKYSILGNHDYGEYVSWKNDEERSKNINKLIKYQEKIGFKILLNENITIQKEGQKLHLIGVENWGLGFTKKGDLNKALHGVNEDAFKILLSHDPTHWNEIVKKHSVEIQLTLSGHTHGMQFGIETPKFKWSPVKIRYPHWAGLTKENNRYLYINRGFGFIGYSGRIGIWPEITVIELKKKE